jgi:hypothetical protein
VELVATECTLCVGLRVSFLPHPGQPFGNMLCRNNRKKVRRIPAMLRKNVRRVLDSSQLMPAGLQPHVGCGRLKIGSPAFMF